jgi:VPDSG-CTERM motif
MKTTSSLLKLLQPVLATLAIALICGVSAPPAQANYIVTLQQVGPDVVATGSGAFDVTALTLQSSNITGPAANLQPGLGIIVTGMRANPKVDEYAASGITGPSSFGSPGFRLADFGSGDQVGISPTFFGLLVPAGYTSGTFLSDSSTYNGQTFSSLGVTPGTYVWTWGTGLHADSFTLIASLPDSGSTLGLLLLSFAALIGARLISARHLSHVTRH